MAKRLTKLQVDEVSVVDKGANNKRFLILKQAEEDVQKHGSHDQSSHGNWARRSGAPPPEIEDRPFSAISRRKEGIIFLGAGGDLKEWVQGVTSELENQGIVSDMSWFDDVYTVTTSGGRTDLVFTFNRKHKINIGKLAMWRLQWGDASWISDYLVNYAGQHGAETPAEDEGPEDSKSVRKTGRPSLFGRARRAKAGSPGPTDGGTQMTPEDVRKAVTEAAEEILAPLEERIAMLESAVAESQTDEDPTEEETDEAPAKDETPEPLTPEAVEKIVAGAVTDAVAPLAEPHRSAGVRRRRPPLRPGRAGRAHRSQSRRRLLLLGRLGPPSLASPPARSGPSAAISSLPTDSALIVPL